MSMCTQVIIHSGMLSLILDRNVLMFKVCKWESPSVCGAADRRELAAGLTPRIQTPPLARHHTHALRSQAELSCFNTDLLPTVEETVHRSEIVALKKKEDEGEKKISQFQPL